MYHGSMFAHEPLNTLPDASPQSAASLPPDQKSSNQENDRLQRARQYSRIRVKLGIVSTLLFFGMTLLFISLGVTRWIENLSYSVTPSPYPALLIFFILFGLLSGIVTLPLRIYSGYILEHRFGLSNQSFAAWVWDGVKGMLVGAVIGTPVLLLFYYFLRTYETNWWLPVGIMMILFSVILARIAPTLIFPLFYKFKPLDDGELKERILKRCEEAGMNVRGIFQFDMSTKTKKANAAFTGIGKAKRIILGDTLLEKFNHDEIDVVFTHELGHYKLGHIRRMMAVGIVGTMAALFIAAQLYTLSIGWFGFTSVTQLAALPLLTLWMGLYGLLTGPLDNWLSRRHEYQADRYALKMTRNKEAFVSTMRKLASMNLSDPEPPRWVEILFHSHPTIEKRIAAAEEFA
jgi:STE24 endopeptidase